MNRKKVNLGKKINPNAYPPNVKKEGKPCPYF